MGSDYSSSVTTNRDTFDLRSQNPRQSYVRWRVTAGHAIVYEKRTRKSRALGEFRRDSLIDIVGSRGDWLEVNYPDHGFIERSTATLETVALEVPARTR